ncbi:hypothetical protein TWF730_005676 [Orbilia blumenaviensis]|uniref:MARVEL domain-containing protein n=1 Tax=Orbilia blumenaviensis TaxID=1796055 RepID=A0AAV9VLB7_9PEZI
MRRNFNNRYNSKPKFRASGRWLVIRYFQDFICLICLPFFSITANTRVSYAKGAPKLTNIEGGWSFLLVIACLSAYMLFSILIFLVFACGQLTLSPLGGFIIDLSILALWIVGLVGVFVAHFSFANSIAAESEWSSISNTPKVGLWMAAVGLVICFITSAYTTYLSYLQFKQARSLRHRHRLSAEAPLVTSTSSSSSQANNTTVTTTASNSLLPSPPQTAARPASASSSLWSRIRPFSSTGSINFGRRRDEESGIQGDEPKPEEATTITAVAGGRRDETAGLTREQIIAQRVEASRAPPTYWYATSNQPRREVHDPEAGDESLPLYQP